MLLLLSGVLIVQVASSNHEDRKAGHGKAPRRPHIKNRSDAEIARDFGLPLIEDLHDMSLRDLVSTRSTSLNAKPAEYFLRLFAHHKDVQKMTEITKDMTPDEMAERWTFWRQKERDRYDDTVYNTRLTRALNRHLEKVVGLSESTRKLIDGRWSAQVVAQRLQRKKAALAAKRQDPEYDEKLVAMHKKWMTDYNERKKEARRSGIKELKIDQMLRKEGMEPKYMTAEEIEEATRNMCFDLKSYNQNTRKLLKYLQKVKGCSTTMLLAIKGRRAKELHNFRGLQAYHRARQTGDQELNSVNNSSGPKGHNMALLLSQSEWWRCV